MPGTAEPSVDRREPVVAAVVAGSAHALTPVLGVPAVARAVRTLLASGLVDRVVVLAAPAQHRELQQACAALPVSVRAAGQHALRGVGAHAAQRSPGTGSDAVATASVQEIVLLHDACRPLAPGALAAAVVAAVRGGHGMAVPVLPLTDTVKRVRAGVVTGTPDRSQLRVLQTPLAVRADLLPAELGGDPLDVVRRHTAAGGAVHTVPGHPAAFAVHSPWDLELAELVAEGTIAL
nr:2-C-methyl-D-erythritol 4-phosphate cytidylyltransferase [Pseudonocardia kunmingensis]